MTRRGTTAQSGITTPQGAEVRRQTQVVESAITAQSRIATPPQNDIRTTSPQSGITTPPHAVTAAQGTFTSPPQSVREVPQAQDENPTYFPPEDAVPNDAKHIAETFTHHADANTTAGDMKDESFSSSEGFTSSNVMDALQRPIAELEKKLGIRFDDFSDEEKEDEGEDDPFGAGHESDDDDDETIEDDRAKLLQRAKKLLEMESFDSDSDVDLSI
ncbi:hypothetical protein BBJ29_006990 [Phytophthora kernoviae]|uniref:Uncharacterized protein n=1 Tax=Phytophthora kernoviae TaxID=325452 RepID=A0A421G651_9STRA|nr:hypothetical protein BBJ29_006990 [Phytophthora kernoviae]